MKELSIGLQDFETLRRENMLYVDKTERLLELVTKGRRYFYQDYAGSENL